MRSTVRVLFGLILISAVFGSTAPAASAAANPSGILVTAYNGCPATASSIVGNPGDRVSIIVARGCKAVALSGSAAISPATFSIVGPKAQTITLGSGGTGSFVLVSSGVGTTHTTTISVTVRSTPVAGPGLVGHDTLQQIGVPASGSCDDVPIETGHYHDFPIGGWSKSWAWWINNGTGGPVCTRELLVTPSGEIVLVG